ncbi:MAG TPA: FG-GAP-like repeat-containing protein, partial [Candidatus Nanopelagicales bacterium]|nr:FG-GAP-like repeat-containing protein [Candidatus Nanopelagicales bacterium]
MSVTRAACKGAGTGERGALGARLRSALVLMLCVLVVVSCQDASPRRVFGRSRSALQIDPPPPMEPVCPSPDDGPDPRPAPLSPSPSVAAGTLPGSFAVTSGGEATYSMPLPVLPGRAGIEPSLSITYDSSAGEGPLGVGFTLSGLSAISRCPRNVAQDGEIAPVRDDERDALCMDGRRLLPVNHDPSQGQPREYRTFPDTFTRITANFAESEGWDAARGPRSLEAFTRSGLVLEYGTLSKGRVLARQGVVRSWLLTRIRDRSGNRLHIVYRNDLDPAEGYTVEHAPLRIDYTDHPLAPASRAVVFDYSELEGPDTRTLFARGMRLRRSLQLDRIQMLGPQEVLAREVRLTYGQAPATGRRRLQEIKECDAVGVCRPPTRFTWHGGTAPQFTELPTPIEDPESDRASLMLLDVTGDGLDDIVIPDIDMTGGSENPQTNWRLAANRSQEIAPSFFAASAVAYEEPHQVNESGAYPPELGTPIDYNHDGLVDVLLHDVYGRHGTWQVLIANANETFSWLNTGVAHYFPSGPPPPNLRSPMASAHLADVTGDGMQDLIQCKQENAQEIWQLHRWTPDGPGFEPVGLPIPALNQHPCHAELYPLDVDADGRVELVVQHITVTSGGPIPGANYDALTYDVSEGSWSSADTKLPIAYGGRVLFLDVNGDGLPDALWARPLPNEPIDTWINTGAGFVLGGASVDGAFPGASFFTRLAATIDFNADGRQDLLVPMQEPGGIPDWVVLQSTGSVGAGTFTVVDPGLPFQALLLQDESITLADPRAPRVTDVDGDGVQDVLVLLSGHVSVFKNSLHHEDLLASVTDGMNAHDPGHPRFL